MARERVTLDLNLMGFCARLYAQPFSCLTFVTGEKRRFLSILQGDMLTKR